MKLVHNGNVYSYILTEDEWYSGTEQQREAWVNEIKRKAGEANAKYVSILVKPDEVLSISPKPHQHRVWYWTAPTDQAAAVANMLRDWSNTIPNGPWVGQIRDMALRMSERELIALAHAFDRHFSK